MLNYSCLHFSDLSTDEVYDILALRQEVFVIEQNCFYQDIDQLDKICWHVVGMNLEGQLMAYARFYQKEEEDEECTIIGRVVTSPSIRKKGEGRTLMLNTIDFAIQAFGKKLIKLSAQTYLRHFYHSLGFAEVGDSYLEDGIPHILMKFHP